MNGGGQPSEEVRRARAIAVAALATAFSLVVLAVVSAFTGNGGDESRPRPTAEKREKPQKPKSPPKRRRDLGPGAVPPNAPGAHKAPKESVPVLAWQVINTPRPDTTNAEDWTPPQEFRAQIGWLADNDYHPVTIQQLWDAWRNGGLLPRKPVVLSFDVGYHSVYANALPVLRPRRWPGVLFLQASQTEADFPASEVKALVDAGWELDSHGVDGSQLTGLSEGEVLRQAQESRRRLRDEFGGRVRFFSYPNGAFDQRVASILESAGYLAAFTQEPGLADPENPRFALSRIVLRNGDGADGLQRALEQAQAG